MRSPPPPPPIPPALQDVANYLQDLVEWNRQHWEYTRHLEERIEALENP